MALKTWPSPHTICLCISVPADSPHHSSASLRGDNPSQLFIPTGSFRYVTWLAYTHSHTHTEGRTPLSSHRHESAVSSPSLRQNMKTTAETLLGLGWFWRSLRIFPISEDKLNILVLGTWSLSQQQRMIEALCLLETGSPVESSHFGLLPVTQNMAGLTMLFRLHYMGFLRNRKGRLTLEPCQTANRVGMWSQKVLFQHENIFLYKFWTIFAGFFL